LCADHRQFKLQKRYKAYSSFFVILRVQYCNGIFPNVCRIDGKRIKVDFMFIDLSMQQKIEYPRNNIYILIFVGFSLLGFVNGT